jgi:hypothetical protein
MKNTDPFASRPLDDIVTLYMWEPEGNPKYGLAVANFSL